MKTTLLAKSSSGEPYKVEFLADGSSVRVYCHCQAGVLQRMCKHKLALIKGDAKILFDPKQESALFDIHAWPQFGALRTHAEEFEKKLKEIEIAKAELASKEKAIKETFVRGLTHGFR